MAVAELHFFHPEDPNGATLFECSTDDQWVKNIELDIQRDSLGSGRVNFARRVPAGGLFTREIVVPEALVRVLVPEIDATHYLHAFFINPRQQQVVSRDESGGEGFTFAGPGPKHYLERMILWSASFSGYDNAVERDAGIWTWPETARAGAILNRLLQEDTDNPHGPFLPDLTKSFGDVNDSAGVPWADDIAGDQDFTLRIQDDYLRILWLIEDASGIVTTMNLGTVSNPLLQLNAYQTFGRDLTEDVLFTEGVNIATDLDVEGSSYKKASHALVKGNDGFYNFAENPSYVPGDYKKVVGISYDSSNTSTLDRAGRRFLRRQDNGERQIDLRIVPGFDEAAGLYMPSPEAWGNGHFWVGDVVSLTTGISPNQTELDYDDEPQDVTGILMELTQAVRDDTALMAARSWEVTVQLNKERKQSGGSTDLAGSRGKVEGQPALIRFCTALTIGEETAERLYFTNTSGTARTADTDWTGGTLDMVTRVMALTPGGAADSFADWAAVNQAAANFGLLQGVIDLSNAGLLALVRSGGSFRVQARIGIRHGVGIDESAQSEFLEGSVRVWRSSESAFIGTAVSIGSATGLVAAANDIDGTIQNRSMEGAFDGISNAVATDILVWELGLKHTGPTTGGTGGLVWWNDTAASDLPEDNTTATNLRTWAEIRATGISGTGRNPDLVGTSNRVARCDHAHHVFRTTDPTVDDDTTLGYPEGTLWYRTDTDEGWLLIDNTEGAAVWVQILGVPPTPTGIAVEEEGTPEGSGILTLNFTGDVDVSVSGTEATVDVTGGGGGGVDWALVVDKNGTNFTGFTAQGGTWSSDGTVIKNTDAGAAHKRARWDTKQPWGLPTIYECEVRIRSGGGIAGLLMGYNGSSATGGYAVLISDTANVVSHEAPAAATVVYNFANAIVTDQWYKLRVVTGSVMCSTYLDGTLIATVAPATMSGAAAPWDYFALVCHTAAAEFRNVKVWTLSTGLPA